MQKEALWRYLLMFKRMYPTHPAPETWQTYESALADINDLDGSAACEICIRELKYFPMPVEIRARVKVSDPAFVGTSSFDTTADFVPVKDWYEAHTKTHHLHVWADKYGRKKVEQVPASDAHKIESWPMHWDKDKDPPITWDEALKRIAKIVKQKTL